VSVLIVILGYTSKKGNLKYIEHTTKYVTGITLVSRGLPYRIKK